MIRAEIERYFASLEERMSRARGLGCQETLKDLYSFIIQYFSNSQRLRFWRNIPLITNEYVKTTCSRLIAEKDSFYSQQLKIRFLKGIEDGEIRSDVSEDALYLYLCMIQGVMDGMLLYPKGMGGNLFAEKVFSAYWSGIVAGGNQ